MTDSHVGIFHRPELAAKLTRRLLETGDEGCSNYVTSLRSGMFLTGLRGIGKTTFLLHDLVPALEDAGAFVIFVTLANDEDQTPKQMLLTGIRDALKTLESKTSTFWEKQKKRLAKAEVNVAGISFGFNVGRVGERDGVALAKAFKQVVEKTQTDVVLIVDEVQALSISSSGNGVLWQLKIARDAINNRLNQKGKFLFIGAGSHPAMINQMVTDGNAAFRHAKKIPYPVLGSDYVEFALRVFEKKGATKLPSLNVAVRAFEILGNEPEELDVAIEELQETSSPATLDESFMVIAERRAVENAKCELDRVRMMGCIASAIFTRISSDGGELGDPVSPSALREYSKAEGREVKVPEALSIVNALVAANLILLREREDIICYRISNPLVRKLWRKMQAVVE